MGTYYVNDKSLVAEAAVATESIKADLKITLGDATGFFEEQGTEYIKFLGTTRGEDNTLPGRWANAEMTLPQEYQPKPDSVPLAKKGYCPVPSKPGLNTPRNGILYSDINKSYITYFFLRKGTDAETGESCLQYFEMESADISAFCKAQSITTTKFFEPTTTGANARSSLWQSVHNTAHVKNIVVHMCGEGGNGGSIFDAYGIAAGGGSSGGAISFIFSGLYSDNKYEVFRISAGGGVTWYHVDSYGYVNFDPIGKDVSRHKFRTLTVEKGRGGGDCWKNNPYSSGGGLPQIPYTVVDSNGPSTLKNSVIKLEPYAAVTSQYGGAGVAGSPGGSTLVETTTTATLGYGGICDDIDVSIYSERRAIRHPVSGACPGEGGIPLIHSRRRASTEWPNFGIGGRGAYRTGSASDAFAAAGAPTRGGVIIEYELG